MNEENLDLVKRGMLRLSEAGDFLGISRSALYQLMERGELPYTKIGTSRRIPKQALMELAASGLVRQSSQN